MIPHTPLPPRQGSYWLFCLFLLSGSKESEYTAQNSSSFSFKWISMCPEIGDHLADGMGSLFVGDGAVFCNILTDIVASTGFESDSKPLWFLLQKHLILPSRRGHRLFLFAQECRISQCGIRGRNFKEETTLVSFENPSLSLKFILTQELIFAKTDTLGKGL